MLAHFVGAFAYSRIHVLIDIDIAIEIFIFIPKVYIHQYCHTNKKERSNFIGFNHVVDKE